MEKKLAAFEKLLDIMDELREKCPWDKKQTFETLRNLTIEETYELADAISQGNMEEVKNELGDLLLHIVFYSRIGSEEEHFDITDVINSINRKLVSRHPHVFGKVKAENEEEVKSNWEHLKLKDTDKKLLSGVPASLPSLIKAKRIQEKVRGVGFDWEHKEEIWEKIIEEVVELSYEIDKSDKPLAESEFGDLLFSIVNAGRLYGIDPENALEKTNQEFMRRFSYIEEKTTEAGKSLGEMTLDEMNQLWEEAKKFNKNNPEK